MRITPVDMTGKTSATIADQTQWTTGLVLKVTGIGPKADRFDAKFTNTAMTEPVYRVGRVYDDLAVLPVPNPMLTTVGTVTAEFLDVTVTFNVTAGSKPDDYETTIREDVDTHQPMIADLMENGGNGGGGGTSAEHAHDASDITSGTLDSARLPTVPISKGGTGATSASEARENLGVTNPTATPAKIDTVDLNTLCGEGKFGFYWAEGENTCTHKPSGCKQFGLVVIQSAKTWTTQFIDDGNAGKLWVRRYNGSSWSAWKSISLDG